MCYSITVKGESWNSISTRISPLIDLKMPLPVIHFFAWWEMFRGWRCIYNDYKALPRTSVVDISRLCYILLTTWPRNHYQWHILCLFEVCKVTKHLILSDSVNSGEKVTAWTFKECNGRENGSKVKARNGEPAPKKTQISQCLGCTYNKNNWRLWMCTYDYPKILCPFLKLQGQQNVHLLKEW